MVSAVLGSIMLISNSYLFATRALTACAVLGLHAIAVAQTLDAEQMSALLGQAQQLQGCVAELDQTALESIQNEGQAVKQEVDTLCAQGKRDDAQARALAFGQTVEASAEMQQFLACAEGLNSMLPALLPSVAELASQGHICDVQAER